MFSMEANRKKNWGFIGVSPREWTSKHQRDYERIAKVITYLRRTRK